MFNKRFNLYKLEERIVLDAAVTGDAAAAPESSTEAADSNGPLEGVWPSFGQDYTNDANNEGENTLTAENISNLQQEWLTQLPGFNSGVSAHPALSNDGILYLGTTGGDVFALDADTGETIWVTNTGIGEDFITTPAITEDMVIISAHNITALDRHTGDILWSTSVNTDGFVDLIQKSHYTQFVNANGDFLTQEILQSATNLQFDGDGNIIVTPQQYTSDMTVITDPSSGKDLAILGTASEQNYSYSVRALGYFHPDTGVTSILPLEDMNSIGKIIAVDIADGTIVWQTPTLDAASGASGGGVWSSPAYDAERNVIYIGVGQMHKRPDVTPTFDYSDSILAVNAATGEIIDHVQFTTNDAWGYDFFPLETQGGDAANRDWDVHTHPLLFSEKIRGETIDFVGVADKSGEFHIMQLLADGTMNHIVSMTFDPGSGFGAIQATPSIHDGVLTVSSFAVLQYTDGDGNSFLVDPGIVDATGTYGYKLVDIGVGLLLPEIYINPSATPVLLADTVRISGDEAGFSADVNFADLLINQSNKLTSIDLKALLKSRDVYKRMELVHDDNGNMQGQNLQEALLLEPKAGDQFVRFVNLNGYGMSFGPTTVVGPTDKDPTNDIIIQTYGTGVVQAVDGMGNVVFQDKLAAENTGGFMTIGGGVTVDNDGDIYISYGLFGGGGLFKYSLPDMTSNTASAETSEDTNLNSAQLAESDFDEDEDKKGVNSKKKK